MPGTALGRGFARDPPPAPLLVQRVARHSLGRTWLRVPWGFQLLSRRNLTTDGLGKFQFGYVEVLLEERDEALHEIH